MNSQVGDLKEPIEDLFKALTEEKDIQGRWATFTYPIDIDQSWFMPKPETASSANVYSKFIKTSLKVLKLMENHVSKPDIKIYFRSIRWENHCGSVERSGHC